MIGAPAVVDAVRVTQEAADVSEAVRLLQGGADNQRILMAVGLEEEADTLAAEAFLVQVHHAASVGAKPIPPEPMPMLLNAQEQRELKEIQRILALPCSDYRMEQEHIWARRLQEKGGLLIHTPVISSSLLTQLLGWCEQEAAWLHEGEPGHKSRAGEGEAPNLRFSLNHARNLKAEVWRRVEKDVLEELLQPFLQNTFGCEYAIIGAGGDVVYPGASRGQDMHSDGLMTRPSSWPAAPRWLVVSIAVHDITARDAPIIFIGKQETRSFVGVPNVGEWEPQPPTQEHEPLHWKRMAVPMNRGDLFIRDPLVWHRGSAHHGEIVRYLPGLVLEQKTVA